MLSLLVPFGVELDLEAIAGDLDDIVDYDSDKYPGAYFRFGDSAPSLPSIVLASTSLLVQVRRKRLTRPEGNS